MLTSVPSDAWRHLSDTKIVDMQCMYVKSFTEENADDLAQRGYSPVILAEVNVQVLSKTSVSVAV